IMAIVACSLLTLHQLRYWKDSEILFRHDLAVAPGNEVALSALGHALNLKGRYAQGAENFQHVLKLRPEDAEGRMGLAFSLLRQERIDDAIRQYHEALRLSPHDAKKRRE